MWPEALSPSLPPEGPGGAPEALPAAPRLRLPARCGRPWREAGGRRSLAWAATGTGLPLARAAAAPSRWCWGEPAWQTELLVSRRALAVSRSVARGGPAGGARSC